MLSISCKQIKVQLIIKAFLLVILEKSNKSYPSMVIHNLMTFNNSFYQYLTISQQVIDSFETGTF